MKQAHTDHCNFIKLPNADLYLEQGCGAQLYSLTAFYY